MPMNRVLIVDKPQGMTSHDVVVRLRRSSGIRKIGHSGTLDPAATGVMLVLVGRATKIARFLVELEKEYRGHMILGRTTDTQDAAGRVTGERDASGVTREQVEAAFARFVGEIEQVPPMVSAVKHEGTPLYVLARKGVEVERKPRTVTIERLRLLGFEPPRVAFGVVCSKGTYVRTLAADVGEVLGCGAHLGGLERVRVGEFGVGDARPLEELEELGKDVGEVGLSMYEALSAFPLVALEPDERDTVTTGGSIVVDVDRVPPGDVGYVRLTAGTDEELVAVGECGLSPDGSGERTVRPVRVFAEPFGVGE